MPFNPTTPPDEAMKTIQSALGEHTPNLGPSEKVSRNAAVAMVISEKPTGELASLFIQRAEHPNDPWSGQMAFPGGRVEPEDASINHAAIRETEEEVGLTLDPDMCIGRLSDLYGGRLKEHRLAVSPFVFYHPDPPALTHNYEVANTVWVPLQFMADPANVGPYTFHLDPDSNQFPSFTYQDYTIWGLTFRILSDFYRLFNIDHPGDPIITNVE